MPETTPSPSVEAEVERLRKWREVRRQAAADPVNDRFERAAEEREERLNAFEADKSRRIREAEERRRAEAEGLENRRMEKARAHLEALDDIETAKARLLAARLRARQVSMLLLAVFVGLPTVLTALYFAVIAAPVFEATSVLALENATPIAPRNPLFNDGDPYAVSSMAPAFQLRAQLYATTPAPRNFELTIDTRQGLLTLNSFADNAEAAAALNHRIIADIARDMTVLAAPEVPLRALSRVPKNTLLVFLTSLSIFAIAAVFIQALLHHNRT